MIGDEHRKCVMADDPVSKDEAETTRPWLWRQASSLGGQVVGALVTTVSLSVGYMIFNDYVAPPPDLSGNWKFTVVYEDTALGKFKDLQVTYQVLLIQEGLNLSGHGEKLSRPGSDARCGGLHWRQANEHPDTGYRHAQFLFARYDAASLQ